MLKNSSSLPGIYLLRFAAETCLSKSGQKALHRGRDHYGLFYIKEHTPRSEIGHVYGSAIKADLFACEANDSSLKVPLQP